MTSSPDTRLDISRKLHRKLLPLVLGLALFVTLGVPLLYGFFEYRALVRHNQEQATQIAGNLNRLILEDTLLWKYQLQKYQDILDSNISRKDFTAVRILNPANRSDIYLAHIQNGDMRWQRLLTAKVAVPLSFNREIVGTVEVERSLIPLTMITAGLFLICALGGVTLAILVYRLATQAAGELEQEVADLVTELESFNYTVSHDLRAPLRNIGRMGEVLITDFEGRLDDECVGLVKRMTDASNRMKSMVDGLLDLTKVSRQELKCEMVDLSGMAHEVIEELRQSSPHRTVICTIADHVVAHGDPRLLRSVLQNLLGNAWKFTNFRDDAVVEFGVKQDEGRDVFFVSDNGAGFDMNYAHKLFTPFQRLHNATEFEGTGVGLATVRRIIQRHGGQIWVRSEKGYGTIFCFQL